MLLPGYLFIFGDSRSCPALESYFFLLPSNYVKGGVPTNVFTYFLNEAVYIFEISSRYVAPADCFPKGF